MRKHLLSAFAVGFALVSSAAIAALPPRTRGTIDSVNGDTLTVTMRNGQKAEVKLNADTKVASAAKSSFSDIKPDSYIGAAAAPQPGGTLKALEVTVFDPRMRGVGDGHYAWDLGSDTTMTNGAVGALTGTNGRTLDVKYQGGEKQITVPEDAPIVLLTPADRSIIKSGAHAVVFAEKGSDGILDAKTIIVGVNGTVPPM